MFLLIIILGGGAAGYWYYTNYILETPKAAFFKYVGQNNIDEVVNLDIYYGMLDDLSEKSYLAETNADITTTMKNDYTASIDASKFDFSLDIASDKTSKKSRVEAKVAYSSNDLFSLKLLSTKDKIGIFSEDVLDKYIVSKKKELDNSINKATGMETNISADKIENTLTNVADNRIDMSDEYKKEKATEYANAVYDLIPEEAASKKENIVVTINTEAINTDAYTLSLDSTQYQNVVKTILEKLRDDDELLDKIVTGEEISKKDLVDDTEEVDEDIETEEESAPAPITTITNIPTDVQTETEIVEGETEEHESELVIGDPETDLVNATDFEITSEPEQDLVDDTTLDTTVIPSIDFTVPDEEVADAEENDLYEILIKAMVSGQKIDGTSKYLKAKIDKEIERVSSVNDGITVTVYVRNESEKENETVKVVAELPEDTSLDMEYAGNTKTKVTYLAPEEIEGKEVAAGYSIEIERKSSDVNVKYNIQNSRIENKKVVSKTQIELTTDNANPAKGYTNDAIIKYNNSEGDLKVNIKNEIKFQSETIAEDFSEANAIFLDEISAEEAQELYIDIFQKVMQVYGEKLANLAFIDNNSSNSVVQQPIVQPVNSAEKETIKAKLIEVVSNKMGEAEANGETFSIENLKDLTIEGYDVSSIVSSDLAIIKVNGYTFNIDKDFMLSE